MPRFRPRYLVAIGLSALLALVSGLAAGFTAGGAAVPATPPGPGAAAEPGLEGASLPVPSDRVRLRNLAEQRHLRLGAAVNMDAMTREWPPVTYGG